MQGGAEAQGLYGAFCPIHHILAISKPFLLSVQLSGKPDPNMFPKEDTREELCPSITEEKLSKPLLESQQNHF